MDTFSLWDLWEWNKGSLKSQSIRPKPIPYPSAKQHIKMKSKIMNSSRLKSAAENKNWESLLRNTNLIPDLPRKTAVAHFRLTTGHDCLAKHLHRINIFPSPQCILCNHPEEEMDQHHLDNCTAVKDVNSRTEKYWRARLLMTSVSTAAH